MKTSHKRKYSLVRDIAEWLMWRKAQRAIDSAFPGAQVIADRRHR